MNLNSSTLPITVSTDKQSYTDGEKIIISGMTRDYVPNTPLTLMVRNPIGNIVMVTQVNLGTDKTFSTAITAGGGLWKLAGAYEVDVTYGTFYRSAKTTFQFGGSTQAALSPNSIPVEGANYSVSYSIIGGKVMGMKIDTQSKSLLVAVQTSDDGTLDITLPRALIDAKSGGHDDQYFVLLDGQEADFDETSTTLEARQLSIPFVDGTEEIEIIGTQAVPEFGHVASLVLILAIISIIIVTRTQIITRR